jgi:hypothetical protein
MPEEGTRGFEAPQRRRTMPRLSPSTLLHAKSGRRAPHLLVHLNSQSFRPAGLNRCGASSRKALGRLGPNIFTALPSFPVQRGTKGANGSNEHADCVQNILNARSPAQEGPRTRNPGEGLGWCRMGNLPQRRSEEHGLASPKFVPHSILCVIPRILPSGPRSYDAKLSQ